MHIPKEGEGLKTIETEMKEVTKQVLKAGIKPELGDYLNWSGSYEEIIQQAAEREEELTRRV